MADSLNEVENVIGEMPSSAEPSSSLVLKASISCHMEDRGFCFVTSDPGLRSQERLLLPQPRLRWRVFRLIRS